MRVLDSLTNLGTTASESILTRRDEVKSVVSASEDQVDAKKKKKSAKSKEEPK